MRLRGDWKGASFWQEQLNLQMYSGEVIVNGGEAGALAEGAVIGSHRNFRHAQKPGELMASASGTYMYSCCSFVKKFAGNWVDAKDLYLGLQFQISGQTHYGWARVSVTAKEYEHISAILSGYAYETIPGQQILAGQRSGTADDPVFVNTSAGGGSLGALARGR